MFGRLSENPWTSFVVTVIIPDVLSYTAVWIPNFTPDDVPIPTILVISPFVFVNGFTFAPTNGAYPNPGVEPNDTISPPLGIWFWLISCWETRNVPSSLVIPVNLIDDIPAVVSAVIL